MTTALVAAQFAWDEYPALRVGRLATGGADVGRHPYGETHAVRPDDADTTVCGRARTDFPHTFEASVRLDTAQPCAACGLLAGEQ